MWKSLCLIWLWLTIYLLNIRAGGFQFSCISCSIVVLERKSFSHTRTHFQDLYVLSLLKQLQNKQTVYDSVIIMLCCQSWSQWTPLKTRFAVSHELVTSFLISGDRTSRSAPGKKLVLLLLLKCDDINMWCTDVRRLSSFWVLTWHRSG